MIFMPKTSVLLALIPPVTRFFAWPPKLPRSRLASFTFLAPLRGWMTSRKRFCLFLTVSITTKSMPYRKVYTVPSSRGIPARPKVSGHVTLAQRDERGCSGYLRFGSQADIYGAKHHVRLRPNSDHEKRISGEIMSALPSKADMCSAMAHVCFGPKADMPLFNNFVSARKERRRDGQAERFGGLQVNRQFEFGRGLHWKVGGLLAFKNTIDVTGRPPVLISRVRPIANQATVGDVSAEWIGCRQSMSSCERDDEIAIVKKQRSSSGDQPAIRLACKFGDSALDVFAV